MIGMRGQDLMATATKNHRIRQFFKKKGLTTLSLIVGLTIYYPLRSWQQPMAIPLRKDKNYE